MPALAAAADPRVRGGDQGELATEEVLDVDVVVEIINPDLGAKVADWNATFVPSADIAGKILL